MNSSEVFYFLVEVFHTHHQHIYKLSIIFLILQSSFCIHDPGKCMVIGFWLELCKNSIINFELLSLRESSFYLLLNMFLP